MNPELERIIDHLHLQALHVRRGGKRIRVLCTGEAGENEAEKQKKTHE